MAEAISFNQNTLQDQSGGISDVFRALADRLHALSPSPDPFSQDSQVDDSPRPPNAIVARKGQPTVEELQSLGIKVKDFGLPGNNPLPPVQPYRRRQIQPQQNDEESGHSVRAPGLKPIQRQDTEPIYPGSTALSRGRAFNNLSSFDAAMDAPEPFTGYSQQSGAESQPSRYLESQDSDAYPDTPLVTPHGSMQWNVQNNSSVPASQLDDDSQMTAPEPVSYSQLGFSQPPELSSRPTTPKPHSGRAPLLVPALTPSNAGARLIQTTQNSVPEPEPMHKSQCTPAPSSLLPVPLPRSPRKKHPPDFHSSAAEPPTESTTEAAVSPRYHLRKRPARVSLSETDRVSKRTKCSAQSAQSPTIKTNTRSRHKRSKGGVLTGEKGMIS